MVSYEDSKSFRIAQRIIQKKFTKYKEKEHIFLLLKLFEEGQDISAFCVAAEISRVTFFMWLNKHENFKLAFEVAKEMAHLYHEHIAEVNRHNPNFNLSLWALIARNRFDYTSDRKLRISKLKDTKTSVQEFNVIKGEVADGNFTASECEKMARFVSIGAEIINKTELEQRLAKIEQQTQGRI